MSPFLLVRVCVCFGPQYACLLQWGRRAELMRTHNSLEIAQRSLEEQTRTSAENAASLRAAVTVADSRLADLSERYDGLERERDKALRQAESNAARLQEVRLVPSFALLALVHPSAFQAMPSMDASRKRRCGDQCKLTALCCLGCWCNWLSSACSRARYGYKSRARVR